MVRKYYCESPNLQNYLSKTVELLNRFREAEFMHLLREENEQANELAHSTLGYKKLRKMSLVKVDKRLLSLIYTRESMMITPVAIPYD